MYILASDLFPKRQEIHIQIRIKRGEFLAFKYVFLVFLNKFYDI